MKVLITGAAGFIGMHFAKRLLGDGFNVVGLDNLNDYYQKQLKYNRIDILKEYEVFRFIEGDLADRDMLESLFYEEKFTHVVNLAAQAGVRYSLEHPQPYVNSNLMGFTKMLEVCRYHEIEHLIYASSSSVYGANQKMPFSTSDEVNHPVSLYAATKKAYELFAHSYSHLYNFPTTGLRFFSVYASWGRPDMAYYSFTKNIMEGNPIKVFNNGEMMRDFTYIDDIVWNLIKAILNLVKVMPRIRFITSATTNQ